MEVTFVNPGVDHMVQRIMAFQSEDTSPFWSEPLYHFYPQLDKAYAVSLTFPERRNYIERTMRTVYVEQGNTINERVTLYSHHWAICKEQITAALSDAFDVDCASLFNDIQCNVSLNPVEPRFLKERCYDTFYLNSERVVESVMKDERLSSINPYFPRENGGCIYPYFFDLVVAGKPLLDTLETMYRSQSIEDFMKNSYAYCWKHEAEIREHIRRSEG